MIDCDGDSPDISTEQSEPHRSLESEFLYGDGEQNIVVISVPFGGGHRSVAEAIAQQLSDTRAIANSVDLLAVVSRRVPLDRALARVYFALTRRHLRWAYRFLYGLADRRPDGVGKLLTLVFRRRVVEWLRRERPDVIVSTYPFVTFVLSEARRLIDSNFRLVSVVTDAGHVNRSWFSGDAECIAITEESAFQYAMAMGVSPRRLRHVDLPLRELIITRPEKSAAREVLGLDPERPVVLLWGGGQGMALGIERVVRGISRRRLEVDCVVATGENRRLAATLSNVKLSDDSRIYDSVVDAGLLLSAADLVIGKAGWISLREASAVGLTTICIDALPGQEEENARVAKRDGYAICESNVERVLDHISELAEHGLRSTVSPEFGAAGDRSDR